MILSELKPGKWFVLEDEYPEPFQLDRIEENVAYCWNVHGKEVHFSVFTQINETEPL